MEKQKRPEGRFCFCLKLLTFRCWLLGLGDYRLSRLHLGVHMSLVRMLMFVFVHHRRSRYTLQIWGFYLCRLRWSDLLTAIHARRLVDAVREAEVTARSIHDDIDRFECVMRPAIAGVTSGMAHAY